MQRSRGGWPGLAQIHCRKRGGGDGDGCCCCLAKFSTKLRAAAAQVDIEQICEQYKSIYQYLRMLYTMLKECSPCRKSVVESMY